MSSQVFLTSLPPELLERIALFAASPPGDPRALSHLARTCRTLRLVVYPSPLSSESTGEPYVKHEYQNQHLWKLLYLGTFDHPQDAEIAQHGVDALSLESVYASPGRRSRRHTHMNTGDDGKAMNWARAFQARIRTGALLGLYTSRASEAGSGSSTVRISRSMKHLLPKDVSLILSSLTSALHSASPYMHDIYADASSTADSSDLDFGGAFVPAMPSHPLFPPPPSSSSSASDSLNITWLQSLLLSNSSSLPLPYTPATIHNLPLSGLLDDSEKSPAQHPTPFAPSFSSLGRSAQEYYNLIAHTGYLFTPSTAHAHALAAERKKKKKGGYLYRLTVRSKPDFGPGMGRKGTPTPEPEGGGEDEGGDVAEGEEGHTADSNDVTNHAQGGPSAAQDKGKARAGPSKPYSRFGSQAPWTNHDNNDTSNHDQESSKVKEKAKEKDEEPFFIPPVIERTLTRRAARSVVYDMSYLTRRRHWGPFMLVSNPAKVPIQASTANAADEQLGAGPGGSGLSGPGGSGGKRRERGEDREKMDEEEEEARLRAKAKEVLVTLGLDPETLAEEIQHIKETSDDDEEGGEMEDAGMLASTAGAGASSSAALAIGGDEDTTTQEQGQAADVNANPEYDTIAAWASEHAHPENEAGSSSSSQGPPPSSIASSQSREEGSSSMRRGHVLPEVHDDGEALFEMVPGDLDVPMDDFGDGDEEDDDDDERAVKGMGHVLINTAALFGDGEIAFDEAAAGDDNGDGEEGSFHPSQEDDSDDDSDEEGDEGDEMHDIDSESGSSVSTHPGGILHLRLPLPSPSAGPPPKTEELRPDWEWIAAARVVVEANMKEVAGLRQWENWGAVDSVDLGTGGNGDENEDNGDSKRKDEDKEEGGSGGKEGEPSSSTSTSMQAVNSTSDDDSESDASETPDEDGPSSLVPPATNGTGPSLLAAVRARRLLGGLQALTSLSGVRARSAPATRSEDTPNVGENARLQKWLASEESVGVEDWAGVEGLWRRCVCWLDYRDLLTNQARPRSKRYSSPLLGEAVRIIPLAVRIVGVDASLAPPQYAANRPALLFEGAAAGPDPHSPLRRTHGVVRMVGDGSVRWSLTSTTETGEDQWTSEAVQLGGVRSRMGVIGMWTGVEHEPADPLGPFWMWKVA